MRQHFQQARIDLVVLDVMLADEDGLDLLRWLRGHTRVPVIMATALSSPIDRIVGLEIGADDYVSKPFEPRELLARIRAVLRRTPTRTPGLASSWRQAAGGQPRRRRPASDDRTGLGLSGVHNLATSQTTPRVRPVEESGV